MKSVTVFGGTPLYGNVAVSGSKNAALPILFAALTVGGTSHMSAFPDIGDTRVTAELLRGFGAEVSFSGGEVTVSADRLLYNDPDPNLTCKIRASTYLIGSCLGRFGKCRLPYFGGCGFSDRPIDMHIAAACAFGAVLEGDTLLCDGLKGTELRLRLPSVGATVNSLLMAVCAEGDSRIYGYAREPHVLSLIDFLRSAGACIELTSECICVHHAPLHGGCGQVIGDMIEAGTYLAAGLVSGGEVSVSGCPSRDMDAYLQLLSALGAEISAVGDILSVRSSYRPRGVEICAEPYPGFPTDLQPIAAVLMAAFSGGEIRDTVFPERFGYLDTLRTLGVTFERFDGGARIFSSDFSHAKVTAPDLRGGAAALLAALRAHGESRIDSAEIILRGYEGLDTKLCALGARISIN